MRYTSNEKHDFDKMQENIKKTGFTDRARKQLAKVLLAVHIMGAVPSFGNEVQASEYDIQNQGPQFEQVLDSEHDLNNDLINKVARDFGDRREIDRNNLENLKGLNGERILGDDETGTRIDEAVKNNAAWWLDGIFAASPEQLKELEKQGINLVAKFDPDKPNTITRNYVYSPAQVIEIQKFYEKHFGEIRDNKNLTEKEKIIAATMKLSSLMTYDNAALDKNSDYGKAAILSSRNQHGIIEYGTGVCASYAESMEIIGEMFGVDIKHLGVLTDQEFNKLSAEDKAKAMEAMKNGEKLPHTDHAVNLVTFSDGTSCMLDVTNHDAFTEAGLYDRNKFSPSQVYFTDATSFIGAKSMNGQSFTELPKYREASAKCTQMSQAEIEAAQEKIAKEIPSIGILQELDKMQRENGFTKAETDRFYNIKNFVANVINKVSGKNTSQLTLAEGRDMGDRAETEPTSRDDNQKIADMEVTPSISTEVQTQATSINFVENNKQNEFRNMLSNNGEYRKNVEEYMRTYQERQNNAPETTISNEEPER